MPYLLLFCRGFIMVGLVSWQTRAIQLRHMNRIAVGSFLIGSVWYTNVLAAVELVPYGFLPYAAGSMAGALSAIWLSK
jgi:O-antigen/teichoic acid export membrane protein